MDRATRPLALRANLELTLACAQDREIVETDPTGKAVTLWTEPGVELLADPTPFLDLLDRWAPTRRDAALAGVARCAAFARPQDHTLHVLAVHPNHQSHGAGHRLLERKLRELDDEGESAYLESSNERNLSFYRRCGFECSARWRSAKAVQSCGRCADLRAPRRPSSPTETEPLPRRRSAAR